MKMNLHYVQEKILISIFSLQIPGKHMYQLSVDDLLEEIPEPIECVIEDNVGPNETDR